MMGTEPCGTCGTPLSPATAALCFGVAELDQARAAEAGPLTLLACQACAQDLTRRRAGDLVARHEKVAGHLLEPLVRAEAIVNMLKLCDDVRLPGVAPGARFFERPAGDGVDDDGR